jgi:hypothetical protein
VCRGRQREDQDRRERSSETEHGNTVARLGGAKPASLGLAQTAYPHAL